MFRTGTLAAQNPGLISGDEAGLKAGGHINNSRRAAGILHRYIWVFPLLIFLTLCCGFYLYHGIGDFPDERQHLGYVADVGKFGFPNYIDGEVFGGGALNYLNHPPLYYLIAGGMAKLLPELSEGTAKYVRIVNVLISALTLYAMFLGMRRLKLGVLPILFGFAFLLSVPMFTLLSASVNSDPLTVLGAALATVSCLYCYETDGRSKALLLFLSGFTVAFLSKATGALAVTCIALAFGLLNFRLSLTTIKNLSRTQRLVAVFTVLTVGGYFALNLFIYGKIFPAPQKNPPPDWYLTQYFDLPRIGLRAYWSRFCDVNLTTLISPYGHTEFPDHSWRPAILKSILGSFPIFAAVAIWGEIRAKSSKWRFVVAMILAAALFIVVYLFKLRLMYLATGYPAGMQARYAFGLLPGIAIVYAMALGHVRYVVLRLPLVAYFCAGVGYLFYPSYFQLLYPTYMSQIAVTTNFGELSSGRSFAQTFVAKSSTIHRIDLLLATYARTNHGAITLEVLDNAGHAIAAASTAARKLDDNAWCEFDFKDLKVIPNESYTLKLSSADSRPGDAVTWWAASGAGANASDYFVNGRALVDGRPEEADFAFKIYSREASGS